MKKTTIKTSIKKNRLTREYEIRVHIDSPHEPDSQEHEAITERITAELWLSNFPHKGFNSEGVKLSVMNHTTGEYEKVDEFTRQRMFNQIVQRVKVEKTPLTKTVPVGEE